MDEKYLEQASAVTAAMIDAGIQRAGARQKKPEDFEGFCNCGAEIPEARIAAGYYNCVPCQTRVERHNQLHRRE